MQSKDSYYISALITHIQSLDDITEALNKDYQENYTSSYRSFHSFCRTTYERYGMDVTKSDFLEHHLIRDAKCLFPLELQKCLGFKWVEGIKTYSGADTIELKISLDNKGKPVDWGLTHNQELHRSFFNAFAKGLNSLSPNPVNLVSSDLNCIYLKVDIIAKIFSSKNPIFMADCLLNHASKIKNTSFIYSACEQLLSQISFFYNLERGISTNQLDRIKQGLITLRIQYRPIYSSLVSELSGLSFSSDISHFIKKEETFKANGATIKKIDFNENAKDAIKKIINYILDKNYIYQLVFHNCELGNKILNELICAILEHNIEISGLSITKDLISDDAVNNIVNLIDKTHIDVLEITSKSFYNSISTKGILNIISAALSNHDIITLELDNNMGYSEDLALFVSKLLAKNRYFKETFLSVLQQKTVEPNTKYEELFKKYNDNKLEMTSLQTEVASLEKNITLYKDELNFEREKSAIFSKDYKKIIEDNKTLQLKLEKSCEAMTSSEGIKALENKIIKLDEALRDSNADNEILRKLIPSSMHDKAIKIQTCWKVFFQKKKMANDAKEQVLNEKQNRHNTINQHIEHTKQEIQQAMKGDDFIKSTELAASLVKISNLQKQGKLHEAYKKINNSEDKEYKDTSTGITIKY